MEQRPALLFLHGFPLNPSMWKGEADEFRNSFTVVTPDLRIFNNRWVDNLPDPATVERMADAAIAELDAAGAKQCVVCGLSMGGYTAFAVHDRYPDRVAGLVLMDTKPDADTEAGKADRLATAKDVLENGLEGLARIMVEKQLAATTMERRPELAEGVTRMILEAKPEAIAAQALGIASRPDRWAALGGIRVPTLCVVGEDDKLTPPSGAEKMAKAIPGAELSVIPGAGHLPNLEQPEAFRRVLRDWLARNGWA